MSYCMKVDGLQWRNNSIVKQDVICYVQYSDHKKHKSIVEASFRDHLGFDLDVRELT